VDAEVPVLAYLPLQFIADLCIM